MSTIVTLGEALGLVLARRTGGFDVVGDAELSFGGAETNVAIATARLGVDTAWIGRVGDDAVGRRILRTLRAEHVAAHVAVDDEVPTAIMLKDRPHLGRSRVTYYRDGNAGSRLSPADVDLDAIAAADVLHVTGIGLALSRTSADAVLHAVHHARAVGTAVSFDVNHRSKLWSHADAAPRYREVAALADVVFAGDDEARILVDGDSPERLALALQALGPALAVVKLGEHGAVGVDGDEVLRVDAYRVPVADTVGAGDAFVVGYLVELVRCADHATRLRTAAAAGACACRAEGDWEAMPTPADVADLVRGGGDPVER
ncbi:sugar kinase [Agrococcus sp. GCM10030265]|uniref:sugar kinase n=1 Tax=Agrococcus sp. GCM10030265 TaxID=3273378 RepID=UPI003609A7CC